jgi:Na+/proline symporter
MSFGELGTLALLLYLLLLAGVSEVARRARSDGTPSDHFLAGRGLGVFVLFLTLYATAYSGNSLLGYPGAAYQRGFSFIMSTGFMMAIVVVFHALAPRLRATAVAHGFVTPGDWVRHRFPVAGARGGESGSGVNRALALGVGALMTIALANFLFAQLQAMGHVAAQVTGGTVPFEAGVVGLALAILAYETLGGMRAVAWTDAAQGIVMLVGLATLLAWILSEGGGLAGVSQAVAEVRPSAVAVPDATTCANWFSTVALLGLASVLYPQAIQRIYAASSARALHLSFAGMSFMPLATTLVVTLIGVAAIARVDVGPGVSQDAVMPSLLAQWAEAGSWQMLGAVVVFIGALAAIMSTADSCLLSLGALVAQDLLGLPGSDARTTRVGKLAAAAVLLAMIPFALQPELTLWRLIELKMELLIQCVPAFLVAIHWSRLRAGATLAGLVVGTAFAVALTLAGVPSLGGIHVGVVGLALNTAIAVLGSLGRAVSAGEGLRAAAMR